MVERGQFLERMTVVQVPAGPLLEGLYQRGAGRPPTLVVAGHPALGGTMEAPVPTELCWALSRGGRPTLRFNWSGVGASTGAPASPALDPESLAAALADEEEVLARYVEEAAAGLELLAETWPGRAVDVVAYSFGAWVSAHLAERRDPRVGRVVLVAPPCGTLPFPRGPASGIHHVIVGGDDRHAPPSAIEACLPAVPTSVLPEGDHRFSRRLSDVGLQVLAALDGA